MRTPQHHRPWRWGVATAAFVVAASALPALATTPAVTLTTSPYIVQAGSSSLANSAVAKVIALSGLGQVVRELPLVNGVLANLTTVEVGLLPPTLAVSPDATVLTSTVGGTAATTAPRQLGNVFRQVTGATTLNAAGNKGQGIGIAVIDTGIAALPDFTNRLSVGIDLSGENNANKDSYGHGTFVAGLIAGNGSSSGGAYVGEAPGAYLVPVKVAGRSGSATVSRIIQGLQWVKDHPGNVRIINLSLGAVPQGPSSLNPLDQAVETMWRSGFVVVTSAGNSGPARGTITSPGDDPLVITAGALDDKDTLATTDDTVAGFSASGPTSWDGWWKPDLLAPGASVVSLMPSTSAIWSAYPAGRVGTKNFVGSGTSFSAAITSGAAALLLRENPAAKPDNVKAALLTTTNAGPSPPQDPFRQGHGVLNVAKAVAEPLISMVQDVSAIATPMAGAPISLLSRQVVSTWSTVTATEAVLYPSAYPFPYSGPATTATSNGVPLFHSSAWNSSAWNSSAWTSSAWNSSAWNSSAWNSSAWNSSAWNSAAWR
jgi:serine protease AprX